MDSDDEPITLSGSTLAALQQFYSEHDQRAEAFDKLKAEAEEGHEARQGGGAGEKKWSMDMFSEDWNVSQFWYDDATASCLAHQLLVGATSESVVAVISAPSVFIALKNLIMDLKQRDSQEADGEEAKVVRDGEKAGIPGKIMLLEHDARFEVFGKEFAWYDFNLPLKVPADLKDSADRIFCDPPFLSEECQTKAATTIRYLLRSSPSSSASLSQASPSTSASPPQTTNLHTQPTQPANRVIICTGERMSPLITDKLYAPLGVKTTSYVVSHARGLSNEFKCYANFECEEWKWEPV